MHTQCMPMRFYKENTRDLYDDVGTIWLGVKKGYLKNLIDKRKNGPKPVVPKALLFDPLPYGKKSLKLKWIY